MGWSPGCVLAYALCDRIVGGAPGVVGLLDGWRLEARPIHRYFSLRSLAHEQFRVPQVSFLAICSHTLGGIHLRQWCKDGCDRWTDMLKGLQAVNTCLVNANLQRSFLGHDRKEHLKSTYNVGID